MDIKELIRHLEAPACEICPNQADCDTLEEDCLHRQAAAALKDQQRRIDKLEFERFDYVQSGFRLGKFAAINQASVAAHEAIAAAYIVADVIKDLEVSSDGK